MVQLGWAYAFGKGVPVSLEISIDWHLKAATLGENFAMGYLAGACRKGSGVEKSEKLADFWQQKSKTKGFANNMHSRLFDIDAGRRSAMKDPQGVAGSFYGGLVADLGGAGDLFINRILDSRAEEFSAEFRMGVQRLMKKNDTYDGPINGLFDEMTRKQSEIPLV
ncbi:MAG: sel1 repeat family protein [Rhizobiales bacterium]|nr:sel1 repeat family protein [Hyphomicrobiales bacterium]